VVQARYASLIDLYKRRKGDAPTSGDLYFELLRRGPEVDPCVRAACVAALVADPEPCRATTLAELASVLHASDRVTSWFGHERRSPYLYPLTEFMFALPAACKVGGANATKQLLRDFYSSTNMYILVTDAGPRGGPYGIVW
jgi:hypothetical protein